MGAARHQWEREERACCDRVRHAAPDAAAWANEYETVAAQQARRARIQSNVLSREHVYLRKLLATLDLQLQSARGVSASSKQAVIVMGRDGGNGQGVRGARGYCTGTIMAFLAQHFLILTVGENNTSKCCPRCHSDETVFATKHELRSKRCPVCMFTKKASGADSSADTGVAFAYDRDFGASINMYFVAQHMARTHGEYPVAFMKPKQRVEHEELLKKFKEQLTANTVSVERR